MLYLPCRPTVPGTDPQVELRRLEDGRLALMAYTGVGMLAEYAWDHWVPEDVTEAIDEGLRDFGEGVQDAASEAWDAVTPW